MISENEKQQIRKLRGQIMRTLSLFYPTPVIVKEIKSSLREYGMNNVAEIERHLFFLAEDSDPASPPYIRASNGFLQGFADNDKIYITKAGIRLIEGEIEDDAVMI